LSSSNGGVIVLDGTNDYISFNNAYASGFGISANATISIWAKITDENYYQPFVGFYNPTAGNRSDFGIDIASNDTERIWKNDIAGGGSYLFKFGRWDNYVLTSDTSTAKMYVNGELKSTLSSSGGINNNRMFVIGYNWDGMSNASISQTLLYNKTLTQQEILQNYNATKGRFVNALLPVRDGLVLELDAANRASYSGTGNTWYDLSGNNYHAILTNGPAFSGLGNTSNLVLDGTNDFIISDVNKTVIDSSLTITFLFSTSSSSGGLLEISDSQGTGVPWIYLKRESSSQIYWYLDGDYRLLVSLASNENALMSITYSNNLWSMYKNGVLQGTSTSGLGSYGGNNLRLGVGYHGNTATKWNLFTINNRALSAYEVKQNFDYYRTRYNI
jgi:hypothetical protein